MVIKAGRLLIRVFGKLLFFWLKSLSMINEFFVLTACAKTMMKWLFSSHTDILILCQMLFWLYQRMMLFFVLFVSFYQQAFLAAFYLIALHFIYQKKNLILEIHSVKPLQYTNECNNWYKLWKSTKLGIFLIL